MKKKANGTKKKAKRELVTALVEVPIPREKGKKRGKKEKVAEKVVNFKKAKKDFQISTKNASWKEIKSLTNDLLVTIKEFIWDVATNDEEIDALSEFLAVQILYNCISSEVVGRIPGLFEGLCDMADRYPVAFDIK